MWKEMKCCIKNIAKVECRAERSSSYAETKLYSSVRKNIKKMKRLVSFSWLFPCLVLLFASCSKERATRTGEIASAVAVLQTETPAAKGGNIYVLKFKAGHTKEDCGGTCFNGTAHRECYGFGDLCDNVGSIEVHPPFSKVTGTEGVYEASALYPEDFSDEEVYGMPARSFKIEGEERWLNIPEQVLERDAETRCFLVRGIRFSSNPLYANR